MLKKLVFVLCSLLIALALLFPLHKGQTQPNRNPSERKTADTARQERQTQPNRNLSERKIVDTGRQVRTFPKTTIPENKLLTTIKAKGPAIAPQPYGVLDPENGKTTSRNGQPFNEKSIVTLPNGTKMTAGEYYNKINQVEAMFAQKGYSLRQFKSRAATNRNTPLGKHAQTLTALSDVAMTDAMTLKQAPALQAIHRKLSAAQAKSVLEKAVLDAASPKPLSTGGSGTTPSIVEIDKKALAKVTSGDVTAAMESARKLEMLMEKQLNDRIKQKLDSLVKGGGGKGSGGSSTSGGSSSGGSGASNAGAAIPGLSSSTVINKSIPSPEMGNKSYFAPYFRTSSSLSSNGYDAKAAVGAYVLSIDAEVLSGDVALKVMSGNVNATAGLLLLGQEVCRYSYSKPIPEADESFGETYAYPFNKDYSYSFAIGPIPVTVMFGLAGDATMSVNAVLRPLDKVAEMHVSPGVRVRAEVKGIVDLGVAGGGMYGAVDIISQSLTFELDANARRMACYNSLRAMSGEFGLYAFLYTPAWDIPPWEKDEWHWPWVKWNSPLQMDGFLFNESW